MSSNLKSEIKSAFAEVGLKKVDKDVMSQCVALATQLRVTPSQMATCWEAFSLNKDVKVLNERSFSNYRTQLIKDSDNMDIVLEEMEQKGAVVTRPELAGQERDGLPSVTPQKRFHEQVANGSASSVERTPASNNSSSSRNNRRVSLSPGPPVTLAASSNLPKYSERKDVGKVLVTYNPHKLAAVGPNANQASNSRCRIEYNEFDTNVPSSYRHMFSTLDERAKALDHRLEQLGADMVERYNLGSEKDQDIAPLEGVGVPRQDMVCCIGRVCNSAHEGRINATSILLEGSRNTSGGARVELDLSHLKEQKQSYSLFPGQIVAVEGMNTTGRKLVAQRICEGAEPATPKTTVKELMSFHHDDQFQGGQPLSVMAVSGPFTTSDNLDYEPLLDLVNEVKEQNPDVVILAGPFVDMRHKAVQSGQTTLQFEEGEGEVFVPYEAFFANKVALLLEELYAQDANVTTQFVLVPSLDDATAEWVYPQPPMSDTLPNGGKEPDIPGAEGIAIGSLGLHYVESAGNRSGESFRRVHCVSNPCTLKVNEVVIGITATDTLFHMSADETNANLEPGSRLLRISQHMVQQQSYYPLFPAAQRMNLDLKHMKQWTMPCKPDVLIVPSKLTSFAKPVLDSTLVVNPGRLTRDTTGGTYATIDVHPIKREALENAGGDDVELQHSIHERTRVEIKRI